MEEVKRSELASWLTGVANPSIKIIIQSALITVVAMVMWTVVVEIKKRVTWSRIFSNLPGPLDKHWMYGSFVNVPKNGHDRLLRILEWTNTYSKQSGYVRIWGPFGRPIIIVCHPKTMKRILKTAEPKPVDPDSGYKMLKPWLGEGLLIAGGNKWARNRRLLTPAFHFDILKPYMSVYNKSADKLVSNLNKFADREEKFEVFQYVCMCTLDIILRCAFSYDIDVQRAGQQHAYVSAVNNLASTVTYRGRNPWLISDTLFSLTSVGRQFKRDCDLVHSVAEDIIDKRQQILNSGGTNLERKYLDFVDILLTARDENGNGLTKLDIRNEVDTFLFEGHDTTASAISWILYSLAEHPEYQQKCQQEIDSLLEGRETDDLEWGDLSQLEYLSMCIKEGMRLHSPVAIVARSTTREFDIGETTLPKGTIIQINIWALHHNEDIWKNHMEYNPERFSKENVSKMDHYQFVPFAAGPRNCIGQHFAMNEEKVVLSKLLYNFTFKLDPAHVVRRRLAAVMRSENGIYMYVERRRH